ncbi:MAG: dTMP kinase [Clostridia bacterium]
MRGKFITFEGCEGVGKSTQVRLLKEYLQNTNQEAVFIREPGGTDISEKLRTIILDIENKNMSDICELMLYSASRAQLISEVISPALAQGKLVICDRYIDSTFAYQGFARGLGVDYVDTLNKLTCKDVLPDATVFLDLAPDKAFKRKGGADANDRLESENLDFHMKVYEGYKLAIEREPSRFLVFKTLDTKFETSVVIINLLKERGYIK